MRCPTHLAVAGSLALSGPATSAQDTTRIDVEYSLDNSNWAGGVATLATPTQTIYFRVRVSHVGPAAVAGLASVTFQPMFTRGANGFPISLVPLALTSATGNGVANNTGLPANLGRMNPFAAAPMNSGSPSGLLTTLNGIYAGEGVLRYAGMNADPPDVNLRWGVQFLQLPPLIAGTSFQSGGSAVVFKCAASIQGTIQPVLYYVDVPFGLIDTAPAPVAMWYTSVAGTGLPRRMLVDPSDIHPVTVWVGGNPCGAGTFGGLTRSPKDVSVLAGRRAAFAAEVVDCGISSYQWTHDGRLLADSAHVHGSATKQLVLDGVSPLDAGVYQVTIGFPDGPQARSANLAVRCPADMDDGTGSGTRDLAVDINDLLYFLTAFEAGSLGADLDDGQALGIGDNATDINDLLYFLVRFELGC